MKVKDLIQELANQDWDAEVVLSKDAEGNGFSPLATITAVRYEAFSRWADDQSQYGQTFPLKENDPKYYEVEDEGYYADILAATVPAVELGPVN